MKESSVPACFFSELKRCVSVLVIFARMHQL